MFNGPRVHASLKGYDATSPCDTVTTVIEAENRAEAIRRYKQYLGIRRLLRMKPLSPAEEYEAERGEG
jgi:hypothetical protein